MTESTIDLRSQNLAVVRADFDAWRAGSGSPFDRLADDATWEIVGNSAASRVYTGKEDFLSNVIRPFNARMSQPLVPTVRDMYADGDTVIALFDAEGVAVDGLPYRNTYAWFLTLRAGWIVEATAFFDSVAFNDLWQRVTPP
ncbi:nuclear transport factor 2 family protein [Mycolicibacterium vaccae]|uniref:nuclear transport factor 2 family protein n=1 Tax=Mycolicibacterium vaccae TaxID=1810 RepID=UPI003CF51669